MSRRNAAILVACCLVVVPRVLGWGQVPAVVDGDEAGFFAHGVAEYANRSPIWSFGPNSLPNAHFWLMGLADALWGRDVWSARLMTALIGAVQAVAVVAASGRLAGAMGMLTTAIVLCLPLELHFERLNMCNVWTTATWSVAFALAVLAPWRVWSSGLIGMLLAAGWYGYQSSRLVPLIVAPPLLVLLFRADRRRFLVIAAGVLSFLLTLAPMLYGFWLYPQTFAGRAAETSWIRSAPDAASIRLHLWSTMVAFTGSGWDVSGFFPYNLSLFPLLVTMLAVAGLATAQSLPVALCLGSWIGLVAVGNVVRNIPIYSCVLICAVPAVALAAGLSARLLRFGAPLLAALAVLPLTAAYFETARVTPPSKQLVMAQYHALQRIPHDAPILVGGGLGCAHGFLQLHRACFDLEDPQAPRPPGAYAILFPAVQSLAASIPGDHRVEEWAGVRVVLVTPPATGPPTP